MKTYTKGDFHNPEQLTRQQVGAEYRLLLPEEWKEYRGNKGIQCIFSDEKWAPCWGGSSIVTYRVPLATPLPDGTVLSSNECCWSDELYSVDGGFCTNGIKKRIYVAGPMTGKPDFNFTAFHVASINLEEQGWEAVNPAQLDYDAGYSLERLNKLTPAEFQEFLKGAVKRDLAALQTCQAIAMLPGWEKSKGAKAELAVAQWLGLDEVYLDGAKASLRPCNADEGAVGEEGELGPVDTGYSDHIKQPDEDGWIPHVPGDPMPCDREAIIDIVDRDGSSYFGYSASWAPYFWGKSYCNPIVKWRPAQPKQPYNSDERAEWKATASPMDDYLFRQERINDTGPATPLSYAPDDPKGAAGAKKAPMWLLPASAMRETAWVHKHGADKYGPFNWREGSVCSSTYISAIMRHLDLWRDGEDNDAESGRSHLASIAASCNILMDAMQCGTLRDDRNKLRQPTSNP